MPPIPTPRGRLIRHRPLADLTWLRVGGAADWVFQPADVRDLSDFMANLPPEVPVFPMGVGSNLIVRDGGIRAVVVRLGRGFQDVRIDGGHIVAGAAALDARVAMAAATEGVDLTFLRTIPGAIGGAVRMNAGCYGRYMADVFAGATAVRRTGEVVELTPDDVTFAYRATDLAKDLIITEVRLTAPRGGPEALTRKMANQLAQRDATQPTKERTAGSTFRNPAGYSSTGHADDVQDLKAWKLIDGAGCRGLRLGGAQMSPKHSNFLINTGTATAADLENLGEEVRKRVYAHTGIDLVWEVIRVGESAGVK